MLHRPETGSPPAKNSNFRTRNACRLVITYPPTWAVYMEVLIESDKKPIAFAYNSRKNRLLAWHRQTAEGRGGICTSTTVAHTNT